jgi:PAS domain S-box-containing protein
MTETEKNRFEILADNVGIGIFIHQNGIVRYIGRQGARLLGYDHPDEVQGRSTLDFVHEEAREQIADIERRRALGEPAPDQYETRLMRQDGSPIDVT